MQFKLCWVENSEVKTKNFANLEEIISLMSLCLWSGEWIENSKGEKLESSLQFY